MPAASYDETCTVCFAAEVNILHWRYYEGNDGHEIKWNGGEEKHLE
jgi:hypothetical protein